MLVDIFTKEDLEEFRKSLITDLLEIVNTKTSPSQKWLKSYEVRKLLNISPGTLQMMRDKKIIEYSKMGNIYFYSQKDIDRVLEDNKRNRH